MNLTEVFLILSETIESEVEVALEQTDLSIKYTAVTVPCEAEDRGSAYSLRYVAPYITVSIENLLSAVHCVEY